MKYAELPNANCRQGPSAKLLCTPISACVWDFGYLCVRPFVAVRVTICPNQCMILELSPDFQKPLISFHSGMPFQEIVGVLRALTWLRPSGPQVFASSERMVFSIHSKRKSFASQLGTFKPWIPSTSHNWNSWLRVGLSNSRNPGIQRLWNFAEVRHIECWRMWSRSLRLCERISIATKCKRGTRRTPVNTKVVSSIGMNLTSWPPLTKKT